MGCMQGKEEIPSEPDPVDLFTKPIDDGISTISYTRKVEKRSNKFNPDNVTTDISEWIRERHHVTPLLTVGKLDPEQISLHSINLDGINVSDLIEEKEWHLKFPKWGGHHKKCTFCGCGCHSDRKKQNHHHHQHQHAAKDRGTFKKQNNQKGLPNMQQKCSNITCKLANQLAMNALDLTAPASDALLKNRKNAWVQVAGHPGSFAPAGPHTIWKKRMTKENNETVAYQALMNDKAVKNVVPRFYREVEYNGDIFIEIEDLLQHFTDPSIMDIKMGTRTFLESEVKNPVLRKDLYEKMIKLDPNQPTAEEHEQKAITKLRYMQFREQTSSTAELGFRIEAMKMCGESLNHDLKKIKTEDEVAQTFAHFIGHNKDVQQKLIDRLEHIRSSFEASNYFRHHEIIGSSVLILWDSLNHANIWLIDFAKTMRVEGKVLSHTLPWEVGNHETGYLTGVDNLLKIFRGLDVTPVIDEKPDIPESNTEEVPVIVTDTEEIVTEKEELPTETSSHKDDANST